MIILGIESTCDETGAAILKIVEKEDGQMNVKVLANIISSQIKKHKKFGGVVPQLAAKLHQKNFIPVLEEALQTAKINLPAGGVKDLDKIDLICVAKGPGLIPALLAGVSAAKTLAWGLKKPLVGVNHMEGHIVSSLLETKLKVKSEKLKVFEMPALALLVSGGHTQLVLIESWLRYKILGETRDDAAGEAYDKVAKMLGLGYPGGARIEELAKIGNSKAFNFPRPMEKSGDYDFSFSGLKTSVKYTLDSLKLKLKVLPSVRNTYISDIAASFQAAVIDVLVSKTIRAAQEYKIKTLIIGGGVSINQELRRQLKKSLNKNLPKVKFLAPEKEYSNDNAAMIALAGYFRFKSGEISDWEKVQTEAKLRLK
ncbi:tRNA (adenosine(37)-N6)-threonylcarbamoyltransferase complex transferase subunit TsaD [Patescibacteria group bacterium]|nr:tRNA (adenosine(37)-N6)-threonylcarbamoyltransferase complex transferase subunit TsaD [Patescibacteria group bacterium]MBU4580035.1 tRNA (adenosine(37)-N6)-threonylcarbamoyltransferase complex transferase subunit TsaD [Patescibacteria group bacterium]